MMTGLVSSLSEGMERISDVVTGGAALSKFQAMMEAQGVAAEAARSLCSPHTDYYRVLRRSDHQTELEAPEDGKKKTRDGLNSDLLQSATSPAGVTKSRCIFLFN